MEQQSAASGLHAVSMTSCQGQATIFMLNRGAGAEQRESDVKPHIDGTMESAARHQACEGPAERNVAKM